jgi:hypothetical protein
VTARVVVACEVAAGVEIEVAAGVDVVVTEAPPHPHASKPTPKMNTKTRRIAITLSSGAFRRYCVTRFGRARPKERRWHERGTRIVTRVAA